MTALVASVVAPGGTAKTRRVGESVVDENSPGVKDPRRDLEPGKIALPSEHDHSRLGGDGESIRGARRGAVVWQGRTADEQHAVTRVHPTVGGTKLPSTGLSCVGLVLLLCGS